MDKISFELSVALVSLFKDVVNQSSEQKIWNTIMDNQIAIEDYVSKIGLTLVIQEQDGYAYLKQRKYEKEEQEIPRLVTRRQLNFMTSLLLVILRKELIEFGKISSEDRFIISKSDIVEKMKPFLKQTTDEAKQKKDVEAAIKKVEDMKFLYKLKNEDTQYEIMSLVRGFVDAQWLEDYDAKLEEYSKYNLDDEKEIDLDDESVE